MWQFLKNEASVSQAVFTVVKSTFDLVAFISANTFVMQLECKSLAAQKVFSLRFKFSD